MSIEFIQVEECFIIYRSCGGYSGEMPINIIMCKKKATPELTGVASFTIPCI